MIDLDSKYFKENIITYLGNKRRLLGFINDGIQKITNHTKQKQFSILDGFAGSGVVSRLFKHYATDLYVNDLEDYCKTVNSCYLSNVSSVPQSINDSIDYLNNNKLNDMEQGIISQLYAPNDDHNILKDERVFYTSDNAKIIDNIRRMIDTDIPESHKIYCLAPLLVAASVHNNTSGVFKGFHKKDGIGHFGGQGENALQRIKGEIKLDYPIFSDAECPVHIYQDDTNKLVNKLPEVDIAYYDPPYNQHPYGSNYFMLNVINEYIVPKEISPVSGIPKNWNKSDYNKRGDAIQAMDDLIKDTNAKFIMVSYNNEGIIPVEEFRSILKKYGRVKKMEREYNAYRGSRNLKDRNTHVNEILWLLQK